MQIFGFRNLVVFDEVGSLGAFRLLQFMPVPDSFELDCFQGPHLGFPTHRIQCSVKQVSSADLAARWQSSGGRVNQYQAKQEGDACESDDWSQCTHLLCFLTAASYYVEAWGSVSRTMDRPLNVLATPPGIPAINVG